MPLLRISVHSIKTLSVFGETASMWKCSRKCIRLHENGVKTAGIHTKTPSVFGVTENEVKWKRISANIALAMIKLLMK